MCGVADVAAGLVVVQPPVSKLDGGVVSEVIDGESKNGCYDEEQKGDKRAPSDCCCHSACVKMWVVDDRLPGFCLSEMVRGRYEREMGGSERCRGARKRMLLQRRGG